MLRKRLFGQSASQFRIRGKEIQRIETFSDAIFAFSISLLIMSLEVPQTFKELEFTLQSFLPFCATVLLVVLFWREQGRYFRYYGFNDSLVIWINILLLVVILFYVYPLKFLFSLLLSMVTHINYFPGAGNETIIERNDFPKLVMVYSIGYAVIWFLFLIMYEIAWHRREKLQLNNYEAAATRKELRGAFFNCCIGIFSLFFATIKVPAIGGCCFLLVPFILLMGDWQMKRELKSV